MSDRALAIRCVDLTTLKGDDTPARVETLCAKAAEHVVAGVCVYPVFVPQARRALAGSDVKVATVAAGFPHALTPLRTRIDEVAAAAEAGAGEIDIVIRRGLALDGDWDGLRAEVTAFRAVAGPAKLKAILATGELGNPATIARAARICLEAGADFLKTSTGMETLNADLAAGRVLLAEIARWHEETGRRVGIKPAGGIATPEQAYDWIALVRAELGEAWLNPSLFRIGASRLLDALLA